MSDMLSISLQWNDWIMLFMHYLLLSLLSIGGAITTAPDMHRYLVDQKGWLTDTQFNTSIALAQAAPGPNILFVGLMGWHVGINAGNMATGIFGFLLTLLGILLPSTVLTYTASRWGHRNRDLRIVRAFKQGMSPLVVALIIGTGWIMASKHPLSASSWPQWLAIGITTLIVWRTKIHLLWLLGAGALLGWFGLI